MKRGLVLLGVCALSIAALAPSATADPIQARSAIQLELVCNGTPYQVVGNGNFTPVHIIGSTGVVVPYSLDLTFTSTPPGGPTETETQTVAKGGPHRGAINCTIPFQSFSGPEGTFTIQGTATGFLTPRSH